jgi:hypothetical protein
VKWNEYEKKGINDGILMKLGSTFTNYMTLFSRTNSTISSPAINKSVSNEIMKSLNNTTTVISRVAYICNNIEKHS